MTITDTNTIVLENEALWVEFCLETGALIGLRSKLTGWVIQRRPELGVSFRMLVPLPEMRNNPVRGEKQRVGHYEVDENTVTFYWHKLESEHGGELPISFAGTVVLSERGLTFTGTVHNHSEYTVEAVAYPCLGDVTPATPESKLERWTQGYGGGGPSELYPKFSETEGYWGTCSPVNSTGNPGSQFMLLQNGEQGLYVGYHDPALRELVMYTFEYQPGFLDYYTFLMPKTDTISQHTVKLEMRIEHFPFVQPGQTGELAPIVLQPYAGGWQQGVDVYKAWRADWFKRPANTPAWVQDIHSWLQFHMHDPEDTIQATYNDLVEIGRQCAEHGISAIQLVGWNDGGQDRGNPSHNIDTHLGTWEELRTAIAEVQAMGVKIILFNKYTWVDLSTKWYAEEGHKHVTRDPYGGFHWAGGYEYQTMTQLAGINTRRFAVMCTASPAWRKIAVEEFQKSVHLGAAGMLFDEGQHHGEAKYCFDQSHEHAHPAFVFGADNQLARDFRAASDPVDPEYLFSGEALNDYQLTEYHLSYFRVSEWNASHMHRYIDPFAPLMVASRGFDDRNSLNKCLQYRYIISYEPFNFKGRPEDFPLTLEYGKKIDALRRQYRAYLWDAECRDIVGATVTVDGKPYKDYSLFRQPTGKRAVVIANMDPEKSIEATLTLDGSHGPLCVVDPENPEMRDSGETVTIPARSVVVVMEK